MASLTSDLVLPEPETALKILGFPENHNAHKSWTNILHTSTYTKRKTMSATCFAKKMLTLCKIKTVNRGKVN